MQKHLNTHPFASYSLLERILLKGKVAKSMVALLTLLLVGLSQQVSAQTKFNANYIIINGTRYTTQQFQSAATLGTFTRNTNSTTLPKVATLTSESNVTANADDDFTAIQLLYRVYPADAPAPDETTVPFNPLGLNPVDPNVKTKWVSDNTAPSLLTFTSGPPEPTTYILEVSFQGTVANTSGISSNIIDPANGSYKSTFVVVGNTPPVTWTGRPSQEANSNDWFAAGNWSNGRIPDEFTDVNITNNLNGTYPSIVASATRVAVVRNLTIGRTLDSSRNPKFGLTVNGDLSIFGNFRTFSGSFQQTAGRVILAGSNNQSIAGTPQFTDLVIQGGSTKSVSNHIDIQNSLTFNERAGAGGGILATLSGDDTDVGDFFVSLVGPDTRVVGESEDSYVQGTLRSTQIVAADVSNDFGNIGIQLTANGKSPGTTTATRVYRIYNGVGTSVSIQRSFILSPGNADVQNFSLVFRYLNAELNGIAPSNLVLFRTISGGIPFQPLNKKGEGLDNANKVLARPNIAGTLAAVFTLGDAANPLPVTLTSFTATAQGANALLNWVTAQELNSKGFEVQVSGDGTAFRTLGSVASATPNSSETRTYQYRDTEAGKQGTRYYRLRQLDLDGKENFFGPQAVTFGASGLATSVQGYPNPFGSEINLALQTVAAGPATVSVLDGVGRQVRAWKPTLAAGSSSLRLTDLQGLPHGLYVVQVRYNDGQTQRLKVVKE